MNIKICKNCGKEFDWRDWGSDDKFEETNLCPDCWEEQQSGGKGKG
jgi:DNA-directed RNA polymerase subunit RPC12/RpoP